MRRIQTHCRDCGVELPPKPKFASQWCVCFSCKESNRKKRFSGRYITEGNWRRAGILDVLTGKIATGQTFKRLLELQNGRCGLCEETENLVLDHDHKTMLARGVLCDKHNRDLGRMGDDIESIRKVSNYLQRVNVLPQISMINLWRKEL